MSVPVIIGLTLSFVFGMAWFVPLANARSEAQESSAEESIAIGLDLILILIDVLPFCWLIWMLRKTPPTTLAAQKCWKQNITVRVSFYIFCLALGTTTYLALNPLS